MKQLPYIQTSTAIIGYTESTIAKSEKNDCFVRAVASSFEIPYDDAHSWVKEKFNRENKKGTRWVSSKMGTMSTIGHILNSKSIKTIDKLRSYDSVKMKMKRTTLNQFIKKYPTGTYLLLVRGHAFTLKNGSVIGNTGDAKSIKKIVNDAFEIIN
jgi:hypothetical protein